MQRQAKLILALGCATLATAGCGKKTSAVATKPTADTATPPTVIATTPATTTPATTPPTRPPQSTLRRPVDRAVAFNHLKQLALATMNYDSDIGRPATKIADLLPYLQNNQKILDLVNDGTYVFYLNVNFRNLVNGTSNTVLGYTWNVPTEGGLVLFADASVRQQTKEEFAKAPKAGK
jgi:hypothetical protein